MTDTADTDLQDLHLVRPRWTHVAIPTHDLEGSLEFWTDLTPLVVVWTNRDATGAAAWLSNPGQVEDPFVLVLVELDNGTAARFGIEPGRPVRTVGPFSHFGIELPSREAVDTVAARAQALGRLQAEPVQLAPHIGYVCSVTDPDGNTIEFSHNQRVYETIRRLWGEARRRDRRT